jgi:drug/metabolite transporter (DMT)-like permease
MIRPWQTAPRMSPATANANGECAPAPAESGSPIATRMLLFGAQACLASLMVAGREALYTIPANALAYSRILGGAALFGLLSLLSRRVVIQRDDWPRLVACGAVGVAANQFCFLNGLARSTATNASVLSTTIPVLTAIAAVVLRVERFQLRRAMGIGLALAGALVLLGAERLSGGADHLLGNGMILGNCLCWALFLVLVRPLTARHSPIPLAANLFFVGTLVALPLGLPALVAFVPRMTPIDGAYIAFIIVVPTVGAYAFNQLALRTAEPSLVATYWYLLPILGTAGAMARLGERPGLRAVVAAGLICGGIFVGSRPRRNEARLRARRGRAESELQTADRMY